MALASDKLKQELLDGMEDLTLSHAVMYLCLYGPSGAGKTVLAFQLAQKITAPGKRIVYIDTSNGWVSLFNHEPALRDRATRMKYQNVTQIEFFASMLLNKDPAVADVGCVILDEHNIMALRHLDVVTKASAAKDKEEDPDRPEWKHRNIQTNRFRKMNERLMSADGVHFIFIAHDRVDTVNGIKSKCADYPQAIRNQLKIPLHGVWYVTATEIKGGEKGRYQRQVQVHPTSTVEAKSRIGGMPVTVSPGTLVTRVEEWLKTGAKEDLPAEAEDNPIVEEDIAIDLDED